MSPVIVMIVFILHGKTIGAKLVGSVNTVADCQTAAAKIIADKDGQEPTGPDGLQATPFPVCIDTHPMIATLADSPRVAS